MKACTDCASNSKCQQSRNLLVIVKASQSVFMTNQKGWHECVIRWMINDEKLHENSVDKCVSQYRRSGFRNQKSCACHVWCIATYLMNSGCTARISSYVWPTKMIIEEMGSFSICHNIEFLSICSDTSLHITSHDFTSLYFTSLRIISHHITSYHITSLQNLLPVTVSAGW